MPHDLKPISSKPYADIAREGKPVAQRRRIFEVFDRQGIPLNRRMIGELSRIPINVVCWRIKGMLQSGLLEVVSEQKDPVTGQDAEMLLPTSGEPRQFELNL